MAATARQWADSKKRHRYFARLLEKAEAERDKIQADVDALKRVIAMVEAEMRPGIEKPKE